jgi:hypothetical protein
MDSKKTLPLWCHLLQQRRQPTRPATATHLALPPLRLVVVGIKCLPLPPDLFVVQNTAIYRCTNPRCCDLL